MDEIHFEDRFENWDLEQPSCYVDGTDVLVTEARPQDAALFSHKFNHAGYRYQVATALGCSKIVWVDGGVPCGSWPDLRMVRHGILREIGPNEKVAADQGYRGDDQIMTKLQGRDADIRDHNHNLKQMGARHETVNARLKDFRVLHGLYRSNRDDHYQIFKAVVQITQVKLRREPLYRLDALLR
ncbi:hypothetical protein HDU77_001325 [Chytriomyces hyalinus]|nr:hypothetical protein HDU77_001325 [Chytriomyces hyalinus]